MNTRNYWIQAVLCALIGGPTLVATIWMIEEFRIVAGAIPLTIGIVLMELVAAWYPTDSRPRAEGSSR